MKKTLTYAALMTLMLAGLVSIPNATALVQVVTEDFEDDTTGTSPSGNFYTFSTQGSGTYAVSTAQAQSGSKSYRHAPTVNNGESQFSLNEDLCGNNFNKISWYMRPDSGSSPNQQGVVLTSQSNLGTNPFVHLDFIAIYWDSGDHLKFYVKNGGTESFQTLRFSDTSGTAWRHIEILQIKCTSPFSVQARVDGGATVTASAGTSLVPMNAIQITHMNHALQSNLYIDNLQIDSMDIPLAAGPRTEFSDPIYSVYTTNDHTPYTYTMNDKSVVTRYDTTTSTPASLLSLNICSPTFTGVAGSTDPSGFNYFHVSDNDNVATICGDGSNHMLQVHDKTLNVQLTKVTGVAPTAIPDPFRIYSEKRSDADTYTVASMSSNGEYTQFYAGVPTLTAKFPYNCGTAQASNAAVDRQKEEGSTFWLIDDSCGVRGYATEPPGLLFTAASVVGNGIAAHEDIVWTSDSTANTLKRHVAGGSTLTQTHSVNTDYGNIRVSWDARYLVAWKLNNVWLINATDLTEMADFQTNAGDTIEECDIDANNNYVWCGGVRTGGGGFLQSLDVFPYTVSEAGDGNATTPNPAVPEGQFDPPTPGGGGGGGNTGTITPNEPKSVVGVDVVAIGDDVIGDGNLFAVIVALAVIGGLAAAGAVGGSQVGIPLWGGVGGGVLGFFGTVMLGWIPVWFLIFIFVLGAAVVVYRFTSNGADG